MRLSTSSSMTCGSAYGTSRGRDTRSQLEFGSDFELRFESQRLAVVKVDFGHVGSAHDFPVLFVRLLRESLRQHVLEHVLPDLALNRVLIRLTGALPGRKPGRRAFFCTSPDDVLGFADSLLRWER